MSTKKIILIVVAVLAGMFFLLVAGIVLLFVVFGNSETPEKTFEKFQKASLQKSTSYMKESVYPTNENVSQNMRGSLDLIGQKLDAYGEIACKVNSSSGNFTITFGVYANNATSAISFLNASGNMKISGASTDMGKLLTPVMGKWFQSPDADAAIKEQLDNYVMFNNVNVYAPKANTESVYSSMVKNNVFQLVNSKKATVDKRDVYVYTVRTNKTDYVKFLNDAFPTLKQKDLIVESVFDDKKDARETELTVDAKTYDEVSSLFRSENHCGTYIEQFTGTKDSTLSNELGYKSEQVTKTEASFSAPTGILPFDQLSKLLAQ